MLFFHTKDIIQLEECALPLMSCRFSYSDKSAAIVYKFLHRSDNRLIDPVFTAALCRICITDIDDNIKMSSAILGFSRISSKLIKDTSNGAPLNASIIPK